jgi:hypothetical protein
MFNLNYFNVTLTSIYKGNDALFVAITLHVCGQTELLKIEFTKYGMTNKNQNEIFSVLALRYRYLIEHAELLADAISSVLFGMVLLTCLIISLMGKYLLSSAFFCTIRPLYHYYNIVNILIKETLS